MEWLFPTRIPFDGHTVQREPLSVDHVSELWHAAEHAESSRTYLRYGPFGTEALMRECVRCLATREEQPFWTVRPRATNQAQGWLSLCDVYPTDGAIEIGSIWFSPALQRTRASTEAVLNFGPIRRDLCSSIQRAAKRRSRWWCASESGRIEIRLPSTPPREMNASRSDGPTSSSPD